MSQREERPDKAVIELEPDDMGSGTVAENGTLYVGREHAGAEVRWVIERDD